VTKNKTMMLVALAAIPVVIAAAYFIAQPSGSTEIAKEVRDSTPKVAGTAAKPASTQFSSQTAHPIKIACKGFVGLTEVHCKPSVCVPRRGNLESALSNRRV